MLTNSKVTMYIQSRAITWHETCNIVNIKMQYTFIEVINRFWQIAFFIVEFCILNIDGLICILNIDGLHLYIVYFAL